MPDPSVKCDPFRISVRRHPRKVHTDILNNAMPATIDFSRFANGTDAERLEISQALVSGLKHHHGAVRLSNCGITELVSTGFLKLAAEFFALPAEVKLKMSINPGPHPQRGYGSVGSEQLSRLRSDYLQKDSKVLAVQNVDDLADMREHFDAGPPNDGRFPNQWPAEAEFPDFQGGMESYWSAFHDVGMRIVSALELGLSLPIGTLSLLCQESCSEIRINHYPQAPIHLFTGGKKKRIWPHTDTGVISMLFEDGVHGLQIKDQSQDIPAHAQPFVPFQASNTDEGLGGVTLLAGDTLQRWTNDTIKAAVHQVLIPESMKTLAGADCPERYSGVFFVKPSFCASVKPLSNFVTDQNPPRYKDQTYLAYHKSRIGKVYKST